MSLAYNLSRGFKGTLRRTFKVRRKLTVIIRKTRSENRFNDFLQHPGIGGMTTEHKLNRSLHPAQIFCIAESSQMI